jgi:hypothetical protein
MKIHPENPEESQTFPVINLRPGTVQSPPQLGGFLLGHGPVQIKPQDFKSFLVKSCIGRGEFGLAPKEGRHRRVVCRPKVQEHHVASVALREIHDLPCGGLGLEGRRRLPNFQERPARDSFRHRSRTAGLSGRLVDKRGEIARRRSGQEIVATTGFLAVDLNGTVQNAADLPRGTGRRRSGRNKVIV